MSKGIFFASFLCAVAVFNPYSALGEPESNNNGYNSGPSAPTIVDATGQVVGQIVGLGTVGISGGNDSNMRVIRKFGTMPLIFEIGTQGLRAVMNSPGGVIAFFTDTNCKSSPYASAEKPNQGIVYSPGKSPQYFSSYYDSFFTEGIIVYASQPYSIQTINSNGIYDPMTTSVSACYPIPTQFKTLSVGKLAFAKIGPFTPPFRIK